MKRAAISVFLFAGCAILGILLFTRPACACGDIFPIRLYELGAMNPVRDRAPEIAAEAFLKRQGQRSCDPVDLDLCRYALASHAVLDWRLVARENTETGVELYYQVQAEDSSEKVWGQAVIDVDRTRNGWNVTAYGAVY